MCNITSFHFAVVSDVREGGGEAHHDGGGGEQRNVLRYQKAKRGVVSVTLAGEA